MIELVFMVCLTTEAQHCEERNLLFQETSLLTCMLQGQAQLAEWSEVHSDWEIRKWQCRWHDISRVEI